MTVRELRRTLQGLPLNMKVVIGANQSLQDICEGSVDILQVQFEGTNKKEYILILPECKCKLQGCNVTANGLNANPELN
ncbi:MAG: hypothetical protein ABIP51_22680 [Bacteroidia bacterium]